MKTILAKFQSIDMADLAAKELKDKGYIKHNIEIDENNNFQDNDDWDFFVLPVFSMGYSSPYVAPFFPSIAPYLDQTSVSEDYRDDMRSNEVIFCAKCEEENLPIVESILLNHSGYEIKIMN